MLPAAVAVFLHGGMTGAQATAKKRAPAPDEPENKDFQVK